MRKTGQSVNSHSAPRSSCWRPSGNAMRHLRARRVSLSVLASFETPPSVFETPPATPRPARARHRRCRPSRWQLLTQWTRPRTSVPSRIRPLSVAQRLGPKRNRRRSGCAKQRLPSTTGGRRRVHPPAPPLHPARPLLPHAPQHAASRAWTMMTRRRRAMTGSMTTGVGLRPCTSHARREAHQRP